MNNDIIIKISIDGSEASEEVDKLEKHINGIIKALTSPIKTGIQQPTAETMKDFNNIKIILDELHKASDKPLQLLNYMPQWDLPGRHKSNSEGKFNEESSSEKKKSLQDSSKDFKAYQNNLTDIERKYSTQRQKINFEENRHKLASIEFMLLSAETLFGRQAAIYKTLSMAEATISTYNAANAALLPPPVGAGPILGEIQAGLVILNGLKRVEKIAAAQIPGYAKGGIVVGERGPEVIENMQDYASGRAELVQKTIRALQNDNHNGLGLSNELIGELKNLRSDIKAILNRPAIAFLDDKQAKKVYYRGNYIARKTR